MKKFTQLRSAAILIVPFLVELVSGFQSVGAQDRAIPRIGIITTGSPEALAHLLEGFKEGLREHGYVDGQNVRLDVRYAEGKAERLSVFAKELASTKVDVIVAIPNPSIQAARQATQTIPIVMPIGSDPVGAGFVNTLARPGETSRD